MRNTGILALPSQSTIESPGMPYRVGPFVIDPKAYELRARGTLVPVEAKVLDLLILLIEHRARAVSKDEIIRSIWAGRSVSDASLSTCIKTARRVLGDTGSEQRLIRTIHGRGFRFVGDVTTEPDGVLATDTLQLRISRPSRTPAPPCDRPSLAVLPFRRQHGKVRGRPVAEFLADEITLGLSRVRSFFVVAHASSRRLAHPDIDVQRVARSLGVRYVVRGTVDVVDGTAVVSVQLIDGHSRQIVWSHKFRCEPLRSVGLHEDVTEAIIGALAPNILVAEIERVRRKPPNSLEAYDCVLRAMPKCWALDKASCAEAIALLDTALAAEPDYGLALALRSWCHGQHSVYNWSDNPEEKQRALTLARRAATIDGRDPLVLVLLGTAECLAHNIDAAAVHVSQGLALDPNSAWGWNRSGYIHNYRGRAEIAIEHFDRSRQLSPLDPMSHSTDFGMAGACFVARRYDEALAWIDKALMHSPDMIWMHRLSAACAAMASDRDKAARSVRLVQSFAPGITSAQLADAVPWQVPEIRERYRSALTEAGFPR